MLLMLIEQKYQLDEVIFYDTGMEFQAIYDTRDRVKRLLEENNIKYTELKPEIPFLDKMFNIKVHKRDGTIQSGYGLCGGRCRWGTTDKNRIIKKYLKNKYGKGNYREYVGIAVDEDRFKTDVTKCYPLRYWRMTEKDCLEHCREQGYNWIEDGVNLYSILDRVSCWCCANKNMKELRNYKKYLPKYFEDLTTMTEGIWAKAQNDKFRETTEKFLKKLEEIKLEED